MTRRKATIHDIARKLNTSASTVSRALHNHPRISPEMKEAVRKVAAELHYYPDSVAAGLRKGKRNVMGVIVPQVDRHFFARVIRGVDEVAVSEGFQIIIGQSYESLEREIQLVDSMTGGMVDGIILSISMETHTADHFQTLSARGIPVVFFDRTIDSPNSDQVVVDDFQAAFSAVEHLIKSGYRKIAHLAGPGHINVYKNRQEGYLKAIEKYVKTGVSGFDIQLAITRESGYEAIRKWKTKEEMPDAVFCAGDYSALGCLLAARELRIKIPEQLAVVGFANEPFTSIMSPALTSIEQHGLEIGREAAKLLVERIRFRNEKSGYRKVVLIPELLIRESSKKITL